MDYKREYERWSSFATDTDIKTELEGMSEEQFENIDPHGEEGEKHWHDMEPIPFIDVVEAEDEEKACALAGERRRYDPRTLYAIQV